MQRTLIGNKIRIEVEVLDVGEALPEDPAGLKFYCAVEPIDLGPPVVYDYEYEYGVDPEVVRDREGTYHVDLVPSDAGTYHYRWETVVAVPGDLSYAKEGGFIIDASVF